jgi:hypothetical protein
MGTPKDLSKDDTGATHGSTELVVTTPVDREVASAPRSWQFSKRALFGIVAGFLVVFFGLALLASRTPDTFDVKIYAPALVGKPAAELTPGTHTAVALVGVLDNLLDKPFGYLQNDVAPPFSLLDNAPSWERGVVMELRDTVRALRNDFARMQTQSAEDTDLVRADSQLHFDAASWILPATEDEFRKGRQALVRYIERLNTKGGARAGFDIRADNLNFYLSTVEKRLGSYGQRLAGSVGEWRAPTWLGGEPVPPGSDYVAWVEADDVFFEARGYAWALLHTLRGIEIDFADMLEAKNAEEPLAKIIAKLEETQATVFSPVILTNSGFGVLTNHSLVMTSYISRANAAIIDFRLLLSEG